MRRSPTAIHISVSRGNRRWLAIHYSVSGTGPATVMLVHGALCDETVWSEQVPALLARHRVITIDLPGHGKSEPLAAGKASMDLYARSLEAVRAEVKADRLVLPGHSAGAPAIIQSARLYPKRVMGLIFVDDRVTFGPNGPGKFERPQWLGEEGRKALERLILATFGPGTTPELQARLRTMMLQATDVAGADARAAYYDPAIWKEQVLSFPCRRNFRSWTITRFLKPAIS